MSSELRAPIGAFGVAEPRHSGPGGSRSEQTLLPMLREVTRDTVALARPRGEVEALMIGTDELGGHRLSEWLLSWGVERVVTRSPGGAGGESPDDHGRFALVVVRATGDPSARPGLIAAAASQCALHCAIESVARVEDRDHARAAGLDVVGQAPVPVDSGREWVLGLRGLLVASRRNKEAGDV